MPSLSILTSFSETNSSRLLLLSWLRTLSRKSIAREGARSRISFTIDIWTNCVFFLPPVQMSIHRLSSFTLTLDPMLTILCKVSMSRCTESLEQQSQKCKSTFLGFDMITLRNVIDRYVHSISQHLIFSLVNALKYLPRLCSVIESLIPYSVLAPMIKLIFEIELCWPRTFSIDPFLQCRLSFSWRDCAIIINRKWKFFENALQMRNRIIQRKTSLSLSPTHLSANEFEWCQPPWGKEIPKVSIYTRRRFWIWKYFRLFLKKNIHYTTRTY